MDESNCKLSGRSLAVLGMIAAGSSYEQILSAYPDLTYLDIFRAAEEAMDVALSSNSQSTKAYTVAEKRERYPRAYEKWTDAEDADLRDAIRSGATVAQIATTLQRNRGAIRSRIVKLDLVGYLQPKEQHRLRRIMMSATTDRTALE